jgi:D-lactate dehydrogenase (cytochrome)
MPRQMASPPGQIRGEIEIEMSGARLARGEELMRRLVERAQSMGGTCTGEHGVGQGKQKYLMAELGPEALDAMRALKRALDPQNIFNPGKIVPAV